MEHTAADGKNYRTKFYNPECDFHRGSWQEQDNLKDNIHWREQYYHLDKTFIHFFPTQK